MKLTRRSLLTLALAALLSPLAASFAAPPPPDPALVNGYQPTWWKEAVVYQVYPRSFKDSNGDGIGDLRGITQKLDYLQHLGINVIWLGPHFDSPNADNGYDIRDYRKVMREFGTMEDFDELLHGIKQRHMRLIIDLVVNHTSDEHRWFVDSRKSADPKTNPHRDFYIWRSGKGPDGMEPPNNYPSFFSGSAWKYDPPTKQFYLHYFAEKQPDLNWDNPAVRDQVYALMKFWLDKGVDGFRMDVIPLISKRPGLPDLTPEQLKDPGRAYANGPHMHDYLKEMHQSVMAHYDMMTVGEALGISLAETPQMVDDRRHELNMIFNFDAVRINRDGRQWKSWTLPALKAIYTDHANRLDPHSWDTVFLSNHDNPRVVSSFGDDSPAFRVPSAKLLATMLLTLRGTPFIYQGDELGMTNFPFKNMDDFNDIEAKNGYKAEVLTGKVTEQAYLANLRHMSRDNSRTPMQWDGSPNAGFTSAIAPWLAVNPNYTTINARQQISDANSVFHYFRRMIALRHANQAFVYGDYKDLDPANPQIFAFTRTLPAAGAHPPQRFLTVLNFSGRRVTYKLPDGIKAGPLALANLPSTTEAAATTLHLKPWEARIYRLP